MVPIDSTPIYFLEEILGNRIYIMRDDLIPFSFGGNKVRKAVLFFSEIDKNGCDTVVTYGSCGSNHCRVVANMAAARGLQCIVISADNEHSGSNRRLVAELFGSEVRICNIDCVARTIDETLDSLRNKGRNPFFIQGGGHGKIGTMAYDLAYNEIAAHPVKFDYIFHASGTGTTQAGLICGKMRHKNNCQTIVGISIARENPRGAQIVADCVMDYCGHSADTQLVFDDSYTCGGYGHWNASVDKTIRRMMRQHGIPMDSTYTGKAYNGMESYLRKHMITGKDILFIHTGGVPLFFDWVNK